MLINKIIVKNYRLFKDLDLSFSKINLITGINYDTIPDENGNYTGNGSAKTTIEEIIIFGLYGEITDSNLKDLIRIGEKECSVTIECTLQNEQYKICRTIPNSLHIWVNDIEKEFSTATLAQKYLNELLGSDFQKFRMYNFIDNHKGINLLDLGTISLRKSLMDFVNAQFLTIRQSLLSKKLERENFNVNKKLYHFNLSKKRETVLNNGYLKLTTELTETKKDYDEQQIIINKYRSEIDSRQKIIYFKNQDLKKMNNGYCPILGNKCSTLQSKQKEVEVAKVNEIKIIEEEITELKNLLINEEDYLNHCKKNQDYIFNKRNKTNEYIIKLKEAQKFSAYKYTQADVQLYSDSIKTLDFFAAYYIQEWLSTLSIIINDLLKKINLSVEFSIEKDFLKLTDNGQEFNYSQLSSGQKKFLGVIFKIGILLQEGKNNELLIFDEGLGDIDVINLYKLIDILKDLNYQCVIIYQNCPEEIKDVNYIEVERKDGISKIK